jgi:hypothetical protein
MGTQIILCVQTTHSLRHTCVRSRCTVLTSFFDEQKNENSTTLLVAHVYTGST